MRAYADGYFKCAEKMLRAVTAHAARGSTTPEEREPAHSEQQRADAADAVRTPTLSIYFASDQPELRELARRRLGAFGDVVHQPSADIRHTMPSEDAELRSTDEGDDNAMLDWFLLRFRGAACSIVYVCAVAGGVSRSVGCRQCAQLAPPAHARR